MTHLIEAAQLRFKRTRLAVIGTSILNEPLWTLYTLISFILHKDLHSTALQLAVLTMLRPLVSIFSLYWSASVLQKPQKLLLNVLLAGTLSRIPFLFFPLIDNPWLLIASIVFYTLLFRGGMPAWIEILNKNLPGSRRSMIFSYSSALGYLEGIVLAIAIGFLLDHYHHAWRWMFPISAILGICGVFLQSRIPQEPILRPHLQPTSPLSLKEYLSTPWKQAVTLLKTRKDFSFFQVGVMLCGAGVMIIQPALPLFFVDVLKLSYTDLAIALSICKGLGFALTSPFWGNWIHRLNIYKLSSIVFVFMGLFPLFLLCSPLQLAWLYIAYIAYGIAQAGSHLSWNLSGPIFAKEEPSATFSSVNVLMVGVRGCIIPPLGSLLCISIGPLAVLGIGVLCCFCGGAYMLYCSKGCKQADFIPQPLEKSAFQ